ncbi:MAG: 2-oxoacid:acceptor oxidoreductase family protein [Candidatus Nanoarchaeia archaeon]|nr:2-oxoacid:acceptor oxidoreductase family protein [Candidatus Nanoarchaeia archaeon]MDD4563429.1 2-oxoacid:acceptor oxidoreductase family protein [Candidatus Nanoarchaeia archaeon]
MRLNILIGGSAGQGINKISQIISEVLTSYGYYTFNYRDYQSLIRGGHNFNILCISNQKIQSNDEKIDFLIALDKNTLNLHKNKLKEKAIILESDKFLELKKDMNLALAGSLIKILGIPESYLIKEIKKHFNNINSINAAKQGYTYQKEKYNLKRLNNKPKIISGSRAIAIGAKNSKLDFYFAYPMTPATGVTNEICLMNDKKLKFFQPENEIAVANIALGASFAGKKVMIGSSGGGIDLMGEAISMQGISEIPLTVYLASRPGPATGVPTYTSQSDLNLALNIGHGEFTRIVAAPGDPIQAIELTNQLIYLAEKYNSLSIILSDKHLAESEYSINLNYKTPLVISKKYSNKIIKKSSYETNQLGNSTENQNQVTKNINQRLSKEKDIENQVKNFKTYEIYGKKSSKNLIIGWGSTKGAIIDAIEDIDAKFLQILYLNPFPESIKKELQNSKKIIIIENNATSQLRELIKQKIQINIENRILKYDGRPFFTDELNKKIKEIIK